MGGRVQNPTRVCFYTRGDKRVDRVAQASAPAAQQVSQLASLWQGHRKLAVHQRHHISEQAPKRCIDRLRKARGAIDRKNISSSNKSRVKLYDRTLSSRARRGALGMTALLQEVTSNSSSRCTAPRRTDWASQSLFTTHKPAENTE